jgi:hypothetical protein
MINITDMVYYIMIKEFLYITAHLLKEKKMEKGVNILTMVNLSILDILIKINMREMEYYILTMKIFHIMELGLKIKDGYGIKYFKNGNINYNGTLESR